MCGIYSHIIGEGHHFVPERIEQIPGQLVLCQVRSLLRQIGTTNIADKECIAGKKRLFCTVFVKQQVAGAFHRVTRCVQYPERELAHFELLPVFGYVRIKGGICHGAVNNRCT